MDASVFPPLTPRKTGSRLWSALLFLFACAPLTAQVYTFEAAGVVFSDSTQTFDVYVKALSDGVPVLVKSTDIAAFEVISDKETPMKKYLPIARDSFQVATGGAVDTLTALFLVDLGSLTEDGASRYKTWVEQCLKRIWETGASKVRYAFVGSKVEEALPLTKDGELSLIEGIVPGEKSSDLYRALFHHIRALKKEPGKKVVFLFSDGINAPPADDPYYLGHLAYDTTDVFRLIRSLDYSISIFPVNLSEGAGASFLKRLPQLSNSPSDQYTAGSLPEGLEAFFGQTKTLHSNNVIRLFPNDLKEMGRERVIRLMWSATRKSVDVTYIEGGSGSNPDDLVKLGSPLVPFLLQFLVGLTLVGGALALFHFGVPTLDRKRFRKKYVVKYQPEGKVNKVDPLTNEPFREGDLVVVKCRQMCSLRSWEGIGGYCPNYPDCLDFVDRCDGAGKPTVDTKFVSKKGISMKGIFRQLSWLWFGLWGGLLGWLFFSVFKMLNLPWYYNLYTNVVGAVGLAESGSSGIMSRVNSLADETVLGIAFGSGLCFALAWVEERTQPRELSWGRIIFRTLLGTLVSAMVFVMGFSLRFFGWAWTDWPLLSGLVTWALFGISIGVVMSVGSSIAMSRAVLGGLLASVVAFLAYFGLKELVEFGLAQLIGFVLMGGILGALLNTVVTALEDFELEYLSPSDYRAVNPISKWLKQGLEITIGKEVGSYVMVKWDDEYVEPRHAKLSLHNGMVYIEPMAETLRRGIILPLNKKTALHNGDIIQLGRSSITKFKYVERRRAQETEITE